MTDAHRPWIEQVLRDVFTHWRESADTPSGLFTPYLDRQWRVRRDEPRTLVSQCRLIYNFVRAYERTGDDAYAELARRGIDALVRFFGTPERSGWFWAVDADGEVTDERYDAYGHAFVLLALSIAATVLNDGRSAELANQTWAFAKERFRHEHGGLIWKIGHDGAILEAVRSQNPMMHAFEALLAFAPIDSSGSAKQDALDTWAFLEARMPRFGALPEWFDPAWEPLMDGEQSFVEVGHVFEWAFLLSEASALFADAKLLEKGRSLLEFGMRYGYDHQAGGIVARIDFDGNVIEPRKGWWEQCEAIRAVARYVNRHGEARLGDSLNLSLAFVYDHFVDRQYGGWYAAPPGLGAETSLDKGNAFKLDYHVVNMCIELLRT